MYLDAEVMNMTINAQRNERITVTLPREVMDGLRRRAAELTASGIAKVNLSDLLREGAKKLLQESQKPLD
jgi:hypothetical protein